MSCLTKSAPCYLRVGTIGSVAITKYHTGKKPENVLRHRLDATLDYDYKFGHPAFARKKNDRLVLEYGPYTTPNPFDKVLVVIPGIVSSRVPIVRNNIEHLRPKHCIMFSHEKLSITFDNAECSYIYSTNGKYKGYINHMKKVVPELAFSKNIEYIFMLLDDVDVSKVDVKRMFTDMQFNKINVMSPSVRSSTKSYMMSRCHNFRKDLATIEMFAVAFDRIAYQCWYEMLQPSDNYIGWGYEHWILSYCKSQYKKQLTIALHNETADHRGTSRTYASKDALNQWKKSYNNLHASGIDVREPRKHSYCAS